MHSINVARDTRADFAGYAANVKAAATGRWPGILAELGVPESALRNRHGPCPGCGGRDRFRFDNRDGRGTFICSQGGNDELAGDEHLLASGFWEVHEHPTEGRMRLAGVSTRFSATPGGIRRLLPGGFRLERHEIILYGLCAGCGASP